VTTDMMAAISSVADVAGTIIDETLNPLLESIGTQAPIILENLNRFTVEIETAAKSINEIVSQKNVDSIGRILGDVEGTTNNLETLSAELSGTRDNLNSLLQSLNELIDENDENIAQVVLDLRDMLETLSPRVDAIGRNLEVTTRNLSQFSLQIRENPGVLILGRDAAEGSGR
jgi:phospholipid/cholesterol/gamma-HCH transport system substrate-binding protein